MVRAWVWPGLFAASIGLSAVSFLGTCPFPYAVCSFLRCEGPFAGSEFHSAVHRGLRDARYLETVLSAAAPIALVLLALLHLRRPSRKLTVAGMTLGALVAARVLWHDVQVREVGAVSIFARCFCVALVLLGVWRRAPLEGAAFMAAPVALMIPGVGLHIGRWCGPAYTAYVAALLPVYLYGTGGLARTWKKARPVPSPAVL